MMKGKAFLFVAVFMLIFSSFVIAENLNDSLVRYFPMNQTTDYTGIHYLRLNNTGQLIVPGINNDAYYFNSSLFDRIETDYQIPDYENSSFSISLWLSSYELPTSWAGVISDKYFDSPYFGISYLLYQDASGENVFSVTDEVGISTNIDCYAGSGDCDGVDMNTGAWFNVILVYDASNGNMTYYLNGTKQNSKIASMDVIHSWNLCIGNYYQCDLNTDPFATFSGIIDEVGIWNRPLSEEDVTSLWNDGVGNFTFMYGESGCIPDWACNGYAACLINDTQYCDSVNDSNLCGENYSGDYSEFSPIACDYCTPSWSCAGFGACVNESKACAGVTDANDCYFYTNLSSDLFAGNLSDYDEACTEPEEFSIDFTLYTLIFALIMVMLIGMADSFMKRKSAESQKGFKALYAVLAIIAMLAFIALLFVR